MKRLIIENDNINNLLTIDKKIRFNDVTTVIVIPSRKDLLSEDYLALWWSRQDFKSFRNDCLEESQQFINSNINYSYFTLNEAKRYLYQNKSDDLYDPFYNQFNITSKISSKITMKNIQLNCNDKTINTTLTRKSENAKPKTRHRRSNHNNYTFFEDMNKIECSYYQGTLCGTVRMVEVVKQDCNDRSITYRASKVMKVKEKTKSISFIRYFLAVYLIASFFFIWGIVLYQIIW